ncbi:MAG: nucleotidyl cyclase domain-containing protein [Coriobacteriia bacterium]
MKYSHFEILAFVFGALAIVTSIFVSPGVSPPAAEVVAQMLLIVVLGGALHWGRNGGFITALLAITVYVVMRLPLLESQGLSADLITMLASRSLTYAVVGVIGGELAARIKYLFAKLENDSLVDGVTGVYSPRFAAEAILSGVGQWERYQTEFSVVRMAVDAGFYSAFKQGRYRQVMRQVAGHIRNDIRMVDDLAFAAPGTFLVLLPRTPLAGAGVVSGRLAAGVGSLLGLHSDALSVSILAASCSSTELQALAESLHPSDEAVHLRDSAERDRVAGGSAAERGHEPTA